MRTLQPADWAKPKGYANGIEARGRVIFVAGQIGWDRDQRFQAKDFVGQFEQALMNILAVLHEADAGPEHIVRLTWFITDKKAYLEHIRQVGDVYRRIMGRNFPVMSVVQVVALIEDDALVEIEATAVVPE
jgi:enamine deaminase RidA (YjgF/YER057c/UK114 family)